MTDFHETRSAIDRSIDRLLVARGRLDEVHRVMNQSAPSIAAQSYDSEGAAAVLWCDTHERRASECWRAELLCEGVPDPRHVDPTGATAAQLLDGLDVFADVRAIIRASRRIDHESKELARTMGRWRDVDITPERGEQLAVANEKKCELHARYGFDTPAFRKQPTRVRRNGKHLLEVPVVPCRWCEDEIVKTGHRPTERAIRAHAAKTGVRLLTMEAAS